MNDAIIIIIIMGLLLLWDYITRTNHQEQEYEIDTVLSKFLQSFC